MAGQASEFGDDLKARGVRVALVASRFNQFIVEQLARGAQDALMRHGADAHDVQLVEVPGAWGLPAAAKRLAAARGWDMIVALGCVIRGATPHFEYACDAASVGLARVQHESGIPIGFGLLTTETIEQAIERAGTKAGNKGADAALAALEMVHLLRRLES